MVGIAKKGHNTAPLLIKQTIESLEQLISEGKKISMLIKDKRAEAKAHGLNTKVIQKLLKERSQNVDDVRSFDLEYAAYKSALGMQLDMFEPEELQPTVDFLNKKIVQEKKAA